MPGRYDTPLDKVLDWIYIIFCFEIGIFLIVTPWMDLWESNGLLQQLPALQPIFLNRFTRGAISGLGLVDLYIGGKEVIVYFRKA